MTASFQPLAHHQPVTVAPFTLLSWSKLIACLPSDTNFNNTMERVIRHPVHVGAFPFGSTSTPGIIYLMNALKCKPLVQYTSVVSMLFSGGQ